MSQSLKANLFGRKDLTDPLSSCPSPSPSKKKPITTSYFQCANFLTGNYLNYSIIYSAFPDIHVERYWSTYHFAKTTLFNILVVTQSWHYENFRLSLFGFTSESICLQSTLELLMNYHFWSKVLSLKALPLSRAQKRSQVTMMFLYVFGSMRASLSLRKQSRKYHKVKARSLTHSSETENSIF